MKPFLKWAGGKTQLLPVLMKDFPDDVTRYAEPFIGGGALFFHLLETRSHQIKEWYISDTNPTLISLYQILSDPEATSCLIENLKTAESVYNNLNWTEREKAFYDARKGFNKRILSPPEDRESRIKHAAQAIFLNKTSFNGLWRVTKNGYYNTPFNFLGIDKKTGICRWANICKEENLLEIHKKLSSVDVEICLRDFVKGSLDFASGGDPEKTFFYFDPPYRPVNKSSFKAYTKTPFNDDKQVILSRLVRQLVQRGCSVLASNSNCDDKFLPSLYPGYINIEVVSARRSINSKGDERKGTEIIISNYRTIE